MKNLVVLLKEQLANALTHIEEEDGDNEEEGDRDEIEH